mmetsp:Transcript_56168/g.146463  ORF Transcript_56168/g.146463 Transcript_56168/m.146463 type:complete len:206 (+) Transcript_56168:991-1608(+)
MQLTHALDDGLVRLLVAAVAEGRVLRSKLPQSVDHLVRVLLGRRLTRHLDHRLREVHALQGDRRFQVAQSVACGGVLETDQGDDVARLGLFDLLPLVGMHQNHAAEPLLLLRPRVHDEVAGSHLARVDAEEGQRAHEGVGCHLEGQACEGFLRHVFADELLLLVLRVLPLGLRKIQGRGQVVDHRVKQRLHTLILEGRAAEHRHK